VLYLLQKRREQEADGLTATGEVSQ
jgi:hypothetical protein